MAASNNNPKSIAFYFIKCVRSFQFVPRLVRADRGSENVVLGGIQRYLRRNCADSFAGQVSFQYGPSTRNQRIEAWWSIFRRNRCNWWINYFKDLCDGSQLDLSLDYHQQCLRFCFIGILSQELVEAKDLWNYHRVRRVRNSESPPGRPDVLFFSPHLTGGRNCSYSTSTTDVELATRFCVEPSALGCSDEFLELATIIMREQNITCLQM